MNKDQSKKIIEKYNDLATNNKDNQVGQSGYFIDGVTINEAIFDGWVKYVQKYFKIEKNQNLLDVGCGSGLFLGRFRSYTNNLYGVEPAEKLIKSTKIKYPEVILKQGTVLDAGFENVKFDRIFCNSVLFYLNSMNECRDAIYHFFSITAKDAKIWLGDIPMPNPGITDRDYKRIERSTGWALQHYPPQFFYEICDPLHYNCKILFQEVENKLTAAYRYDVLIEKK